MACDQGARFSAMDLTVRLNQFATLFRDIGDEDYISARANYQLHLREQFFWAGLQALEKYLKAILLHNGRSTLNYGHNLPELSKAVRQISHLKFQIPVGVEQFLTRLRDLGDNRYMSTDTYVRPENLIELDEGVWNIRAYCRFVRVTVKNGSIDLTGHYVSNINSRNSLKDPRRFKPISDDGFLVDVLARPRTDAVRRVLVWHNRFFGSGRVTGPPYRSSSRIPPNRQRRFTQQEKTELAKFICFPKKRTDIFL
jgi:HEPN domain-containing protein